MDKKYGRGKPGRADRRRKRYYHGGGRKRKMVDASTSPPSASAAKLKKFDTEEITEEPSAGYCFINFFMVFSKISQLVICKSCHSEVNFRMANKSGLGFKIAMKCKCGDPKFPASSESDRSYDINRRIVLVFRLLGISLAGITQFCGMMDIPFSFSSNLYYSCVQKIFDASKTVFDIITREAVEEEVKLNGGNNEVTVSGDGTWKKRGFSSLFGVATLAGGLTGKVFDVVTKSSFCQMCNMWKNKFETEEEYADWVEEHKAECTNNHHGNAGKMEVDAVMEMFKRSEEKFNVKYTTYIGDGDCKTFITVAKEKPYGDLIIKKKECVGHVQKRMGTRLRKLKKTEKKLGGNGTGKLTAKVIKDLTVYYGLAIRRNPNSIEEMKNAVWATYYHKSSTDANPQHHFCPPGVASWCKWRVAEANGTLKNFKHQTPPLSNAVLKAIKPTYEELAKDDLLEKCLGAHTQNNNGSLNARIWSFSPKHLHSGAKIVELSTYLAVCIFNEGYTSILKIMKEMDLQLDSTVCNFVRKRDLARIEQANARSCNQGILAKAAKRAYDMTHNEFYEECEEEFYGPGIAD